VRRAGIFDKGQKTPRNRGKILVAPPLTRFVKQTIACRSRHSEIEIKSASKPIGDLHIFEHVLYRKMRLEIGVHNARNFCLERGGEDRVVLQRLCKFLHSDTRVMDQRDRKSTRLNSSHVAISYAVFCLKKKKKNN